MTSVWSPQAPGPDTGPPPHPGPDPAPGLHTIRWEAHAAFVAIDSTVQGRARGGLRIAADVTPEELTAAARTMTLKYGFLGLAQGGAKAGIRADGEAPVEAKQETLRGFARAAQPLLAKRLYIPDADIGTTAADIRRMMEAAGLPASRRDWRQNRSGFYTAVSCLAAARVVVARLGRSLAACRVAVEGFGQVGSALAGFLHEAGATVVGLSTSRGALYDARGLDVEALLRMAALHGSGFVDRYGAAERLDRAALLEQPVDVLFPCARRHSIHAGNVGRIGAAAVCAGANDPIDAAAERVLHERGVVVPPDFVANCGGVLGGTLEFAGVGHARIVHLLEAYVARAVASLLDRAERLGVPPRAVAEPAALAAHDRVRRAAERPGVAGGLFAVGLDWYRRGWLPRFMVAAATPRYLERRACW